MCNFFSFISNGKGNVKYFTLEQRKQFYKNNPKQYKMDSHSSIASFYYGNNNSDDKVNKYEFTINGFIIDQINVKDDSKQVEKWLNEFIKTEEYEELCKMLVEQNGIMLQYIPRKYRTKEICKLAVKQNCFSLYYVPKHLIDYNLCEMALKQDVRVLKYVPTKYKKEGIKK